jgi:hypothetical protein
MGPHVSLGAWSSKYTWTIIELSKSSLCIPYARALTIELF